MIMIVMMMMMMMMMMMRLIYAYGRTLETNRFQHVSPLYTVEFRLIHVSLVSHLLLPRSHAFI